MTADLNLDPDNRLGYTGDLLKVVNDATEFFTGSLPTGMEHLSEGYEDCNIRVTVGSDMFVVKFFADNQLGDYSKTRRGDDVARRLVDIINAVRANGVNAAEILEGDDYLFFADGLVAMCYKWVDGKTYYDLGRAPDGGELEHIVKQAALINTTEFQPVYYHDIWAVPHIEALFDKVKTHLTQEDAIMISEVLRRFNKIDMNNLPKCLVHGDLTKGNVILGDDGRSVIIDFSVTNWTTRIIELVLIVSNLLYDESDMRSLREKSEQVADSYQKYNKLTQYELDVLADLSLAGSTMEFLGSVWRQNFLSDQSQETEYWLQLGRTTITRETAIG